jgi:hypothetical protein
MPNRSSKRTRDSQQAAVDVVQEVIAMSERAEAAHEKNPAAVALGRRGGLAGGPARAAALTPSRRRLIAQKAAETRWKKRG